MPLKLTCAVMSFSPTSASGSASARCARWHISVPPRALRVVVLGLGEAVVDEERRAALQPRRPACATKASACGWISVTVPGTNGRVERRAQRGRRGRAKPSAPSASTPRRARATASPSKCSSCTGIASSTSLPTTTPSIASGKRVEPAHAVAEARQALALARAQRARQVDDGVAAHALAQRVEQLRGQRAGAGAELPHARRCRWRPAPARTCTRQRLAEQRRQLRRGDEVAARRGIAPNLRLSRGVVAQAGRVQRQRHEAVERQPAAVRASMASSRSARGAARADTLSLLPRSRIIARIVETMTSTRPARAGHRRARGASAARSRSSWPRTAGTWRVHYRRSQRRGRGHRGRAARARRARRVPSRADLADEAACARCCRRWLQRMRPRRRGGQQRLAVRVRRRRTASATPRWTRHWRSQHRAGDPAGAGAARAPCSGRGRRRLRRQPARPEAVQPEPRLPVVHAVEGRAARRPRTLLAQALAPRVRVCGVAPGVTLLSGAA